MAENNICKQHTGFEARIANTEKENKDQWEKMSTMDTKINSIFTRLNLILGGIVVACIMLLINIIIIYPGG